jgi:hypothetical protein
MWVRCKIAHAISKAFDFSVGVEERNVDPPSRFLLDVKFDDVDLRFAGLEQGAEAFEDDLVVIDESDLDRFCHNSSLERAVRDKSPDRVIDPARLGNQADDTELHRSGTGAGTVESEG